MHQLEYPAPDRLLRLREVLFLTGLPRSTLYWRIQKGKFPKPQKKGKYSVWRFSEVEQFLSLPNRYSQLKKAESPFTLGSLPKTNIGE